MFATILLKILNIRLKKHQNIISPAADNLLQNPDLEEE